MSTRTKAEILAMDGPLFAVQGYPDHIIEEWVRNASEEQIIAAKRQCDISIVGHTKKIIEKEEAAISSKRLAAHLDFVARTSANVSKNTEDIAADAKTPLFKSRIFWLCIVSAIVGSLVQPILQFVLGLLDKLP